MYPFRNTTPPSSLSDIATKSSDKAREIIDPRYTGETIESKYDSDIGYVPNREFQDIRAARQGELEAWGNLIGRNLGKTGTRILDGAAFSIAAPYSLITDSLEGKVDSFGTAMSSVVDNPISQFARDFEEKLDTWLPIYQTKAQDASTDFTSIGFADKVANGLSYVAAMAATARLTGGAGVGGMLVGRGVKEIPKLIKMAGGSKNLGKIFGNAIEEGRDLNYIGNLFSNVADIPQELGRISKLAAIKNALGVSVSDVYGGMIESAAEASQTKEETLKRLTEQQLQANGGQPLTEEQKSVINQQASEALTANFITNLATTTLANKTIFHKLLNTKYADDMVSYNKVIKTGEQYALKETAAKVGTYQKLFQPIKNLASSSYVKGAVTEGGQELSQFASNDFFVNLYSSPDENSVNKVRDTFSSLIEGTPAAASETFENLRSKDAMESMIIGGMIGAGFGGYLNRNDDAKKKANTERLIQNANLFPTATAIKELARSVKDSDIIDGSLANGDRVTFETGKALQIFNYVKSRDDIGRFSDIKADLDAAKNMNIEVFKETYNIQDPDYTEAKRDEFIEYISDIADKTKTAKNKLMANYGHKLTELEAENPDITGFLTMIDVLKEDYTKRENELFVKLSPYMQYDEMIANQLTPEKYTEFSQQIEQLTEQASQIQAEKATTAEELQDRTQRLSKVANQINSLQNSLAKSATEANYKEFLKIEGLDEEKTQKKVTEKTRYAEYTKDLNDFKQIQDTKERLIDYYSKIVNNVDYAKEVQKKINLANQSSLLENIFAIDKNIVTSPKINKKTGEPLVINDKPQLDYNFTTPEANTKGEVQDYIKTGDIYNIYKQQVRKNANTESGYENLDTEQPVEIVDTTVDIINNVPVGKIKVKDQRGKLTTYTANQFKSMIKPIQYNNQVLNKYPQEAENVRLYRLFKDRAIKYSINGKEVVGMLGFTGTSYNAENLVLKYKEEGKDRVVTFSAAKFNGDYSKGYVEILTERETLAYQLNANAKGYSNYLLKNIESKNKSLGTSRKRLSDLQQRLKSAQENKNVLEENAIQSAIKSYDRFIETLENNKIIKQNAADRLNQISSIELQPSEELGDEFNKIIDGVLEYTNAARDLAQNKDSEGRTPKQIKNDKLSKALEIELAGETTTIDTISTELDNLKQSFIDSVTQEIDPTQAREITNAELNPTLDLQYIAALKYAEENKVLTDVASTIDKNQALVDQMNERVNEQVAQIEAEYTAQVLQATNLTPDDVKELKTAELAAIMKFIDFINKRGFWENTGKGIRKVSETEYKLPEEGEQDFVTSRPTFIIKTTGNSENTDSTTKKEFYRNIHKLSPEEHKVRVVKSSEYKNLGLEGNEDAIFLAVTDLEGNDIKENGKSLVTTLPLNTLQDTFGFRFRDFEEDKNLSPVKKEIGEAIDNALQNATDFYSTLDNITDSLKITHPTEVSFINDVKTQLTDLQRLRETILANRDSDITINIAGKSNGIPRLSSNSSITSNDAFTSTGKIVIPESGDRYTSGDVSYRTTPGRAYFEDLKTRTFFPVTVDFIGNKKIMSKNNKNTGISFVDNIVNAGKFIQASFSDSATDYEGKIVPTKEAMSRVNNMLSYITYTNNNANKPDSIFTYEIEDAGVVFYIGSQTPLRLEKDEALIRELLAKKIFNIDRKSLTKDSISFPTFEVTPTGFKYNSNSYNYQEFVKNNFGLKTNIIAKDGSLYKNGYLILDKNPVIAAKKTEVLGKTEEGVSREAKPSSKLGNLKKNQGASTTTNEDGTLSIVRPSKENKTEEPVRKGLPKAAAKKPNLKGTSSFGSGFIAISPEEEAKLRAELGNDFKLTAKYYKGDINNRMSPKQLEQARKKFFNNYGIEIDIVKGLIDNDAFGVVTRAGDLLISDRAPIGTDYHEEFHLVSQHILERSQLNDIYSEWRTKNGQELTDDQVEEELAEAFRIHAQGYEGFTGKIKSIFDYLLNQIKKLLGLNTKQQQLFQDIYSGKYYHAPIYKGTKAYKSTSPTLDWDIRQKAFRGATQQLVYNMFDDFAEVNGVTREDALNILATDKDSRLEFLNQVDEEGVSYYKYMIDNSFEQYYENVDDLVTAQVGAYVTEDNYGDLLKEYTAFVSKELNLRGIEETDIDENTTGRDIVKKGDNEVDFFNEAVTQVRLLAYTQSDASGNYPINPAALTKIYIDNLADSANSQEFEETLGTLDSNPTVTENFDSVYSDAIKNINELVGLNSVNRTKSQQFMIGNLWSSFGKLSTDFRILKVTDAEDGSNTSDTYWISASEEASASSTKRDLTFNVKDNYTDAKDLIIKGQDTAKGLTTVTNPEVVFEMLFEISAKKFNSYNPNKIQSIVNAFARSKNVNDYLANNNNDIKVITEYLTVNNAEKVHSFFNAGGKLQHSIQNPSSLFYRVRDNESNPEIMTINKIVNINGIQRTISGATNNKTSDDVTEDDLHIMFFNSFLKRNKEGSKTVMPFVFSGDKSTLSGIEITQGAKLMYSNSVKDIKVEGKTQYVVDHSSIHEQYFTEELKDLEKILQIKDSVKVVKEELPFFSFLENTNPTLYKSIINDVKNLKGNLQDTVENVSSRYKDEVLKETQDYFVQKGKDLEKLYKSIGFDYESVLKKNEIENKAYLNWYASAYAIGIQEQTKMVGSFAFYDEIAKRIPAWNGTKRPIRTDKDWVNWYNNSYNSNINVGELRALVVNDVKKQEDITLYAKNTPSDAQAYISLDAARFLLFSSGTYSYRLDDLFREIETFDKKTDLTQKDQETLNNFVNQLNEYMNVLKPQYYGMQDIGGLDVPTFYKFSVLPLSKSITQGRNLDNIRELMNAEGGPHIVMFDSANKVGRKVNGKGIDLYDEKGNYNNISLAKKLQAVQTSNWEGLGIQVDMPKRHENVTFGTQMRKLITVDLEGNYTLLNSYTLRDGKTIIAAGEVTSEQIRQINDDLIIEKLESDKKDLMGTLGLDESLTVTPDKIEKVKKELIRQANLRDVSNSFIQGIQELTSFDFLMNKSKLQQLVNSLVSKAVIKQTMTGDAKAMVSSVGFEKKNGGIQADKRLKFYKKGERSTMEVLLPLNMMDQYKEHLYYNEDEKLYMFKASSPVEIRRMIGYRIPTQAPASIENIVIKGFYNGGYGNSIVVPFELTSKAGSDFDIDKLNLFMPKFKSNISDKTLATWLDKLPEEYFAEGMTKVEYYKEIEGELVEDLEATDVSILKFIRDNAEKTYKYDYNHIDNKITRFYTDLMSSPTYFDNFVNTIDEEDFKDLAQKIGAKRGLKKSAKDVKASSNFYDPMFVVKMRAAFMNAKDTLGAAALATTHHAESQKHKLAINSTILSNGKSARIVKGGNTSATIGELLSLFQDNIIEDGKVRLDRIYNFENKKISGILSQFINASVDVAKDEYITSANLDLETIGVASLLVRAGIPINKVFTFLSQPGIIQYTNALRKTKITALVAEKKGAVKDKFSGGSYTKLTANDLTGLFESITTDESTTLSSKQSDFIDLYKNLEEYAQLLTDLQQITTFDTKGTGSMLEENEINLFKYDDFVSNYSRMFSGLDSMLNDKTSFTARMREEARNANNFNNSLFKLGGYYTPNEDNIIANKNLNSVIDSYFKEKQSPAKTAYQTFRFKGYFNSYLLQRVALNNYPSLSNVVARTIPQITAFTGDNAFIKRLRTGDNKIFMHGGASIAADEINQLSEAFTNLYKTPDTNQLAKDIILSGLVQFGVVNNPSTIMNTIPTNLLLDTLKLKSTDPLVEAYNKVIELDKTANFAIVNAKEHTDTNKGENHFSNYVLVSPKTLPNTFSYANEKFNCK